MDYMASALGLLMTYESGMSELRTLAIEFEERQISADRFSTRAVRILCDMQLSIKKLNEEMKEK